MFFSGYLLHLRFSKEHLVMKNHFSLYWDLELLCSLDIIKALVLTYKDSPMASSYKTSEGLLLFIRADDIRHSVALFTPGMKVHFGQLDQSGRC